MRKTTSIRRNLDDTDNNIHIEIIVTRISKGVEIPAEKIDNAITYALVKLGKVCKLLYKDI